MKKTTIIILFLSFCALIAAVSCGKKSPSGPGPINTSTSSAVATATVTVTRTAVIVPASPTPTRTSITCYDHSHVSGSNCVCDNNWFDCDGNPLNGCEWSGGCPSETSTPEDTATNTPFFTETAVITDTATATATETATTTGTPEEPPTMTVTDIPADTATETPVDTSTATLTPTPNIPPTDTATPSYSPTRTPTACATNVFGETAPSQDAYNSNYAIYCSMFTCPAAAKIVSLGVYYGVAGNVTAGIYADLPGTPGALLGQTASTYGTAGWHDINLAVPVTVAAGNYWLAITPQTASGICSKNGSSTKYTMTGSYTTTFPNPFPTVTQPFPTTHMMVNAVYTCP
jgi:hypothetical protein